MRVIIAALVSALAISASAAAQLVPLPPQPEGVAWPTEVWETAPFGSDVDEFALAGLIRAAFEADRAELMGETRALIIIHRGKIVFERYRDGFGPETRQVSWSMAKSITHGLVGRAVQLGLIADIDGVMPTPFPDGDARGQVSWRNWLNMTDGLDYHEIDADDITTNDVALMMYGPGRFDVIAYASGLKQAHAPGTVWNYSTAGFHFIGRALAFEVMEENLTLFSPDSAFDVSAETAPPAAPDPLASASRRPELQIAARFDAMLFDPIGMDAIAEFDAAGTFLGGSLVWADARDFARFGYLYLRDGVWDGERLLPVGWVDMARTPGPDGNINVYGSGFWITPAAGQEIRPAGWASPLGPHDAFSAQGHEGQVIWIVPSRDLVIVRLGLMPNNPDNWQTLFDFCQSVALAFPEVAGAP